MDVETERKAPAPGLKEKDEEEKSGVGTKRQRGGYEREVPDYLSPSPKARGLGGFIQTCPPLAKARGLGGFTQTCPASKSKANFGDSRTHDLKKRKGTVLTRVARRGGREGKERTSGSGTSVLKL